MAIKGKNRHRAMVLLGPAAAALMVLGACSSTPDAGGGSTAPVSGSTGATAPAAAPNEGGLGAGGGVIGAPALSVGSVTPTSLDPTSADPTSPDPTSSTPDGTAQNGTTGSTTNTTTSESEATPTSRTTGSKPPRTTTPPPQTTQLCPACGDSAPFTDTTTLDPAAFPGVNSAVGFTSPSGNIQCSFADDGSNAACQIEEHTYDLPADLDCHGGGAEGGAVEVDATGAHFRCAGDYFTGGPVLGYGQSLIVGDYGCASRETGVQCINLVTGQAFVLTKAFYQFT
ncbi:hypothetical protein D1871_12250 [Nakamurella silvestris]|nr:hypothetical protein D1871_12250 [Nakamurella silvestris]